MFSLGNRKNVYMRSNPSEDPSHRRDDRLVQLKHELREHIRYMGDYTPLQEEWFRMCDSLHQIANVAYMESHLPLTDENPLRQSGKKDEGTLWDSDKDQLAIKILLEEGKLNLALRLLNRFKSLQLGDAGEYTRHTQQAEHIIQHIPAIKPPPTMPAPSAPPTISSSSSSSPSSSLPSSSSSSSSFSPSPAAEGCNVSDRVRVFEQSLGLLLRFALSYVEALQIIDMPLLIQHCTLILKHGKGMKDEEKETEKGKDKSTENAPSPSSPSPSPAPPPKYRALEYDKMQESAVIYYLYSIGTHLDSLDEERVMELIEENDVIPLFISHCFAHHALFNRETMEAAAKGLNGFISSDIFQTDKSNYLRTAETKKQLCALKPLFINELINSYGLKRKDIQSLIDEIAKLEKYIK